MGFKARMGLKPSENGINENGYIRILYIYTDIINKNHICTKVNIETCQLWENCGSESRYFPCCGLVPLVCKAQVALPESLWLEWLEARDTLEFPFFFGTDDSNKWGVDENSQIFDQILDELGYNGYGGYGHGWS